MYRYDIIAVTCSWRYLSLNDYHITYPQRLLSGHVMIVCCYSVVGVFREGTIGGLDWTTGLAEIIPRLKLQYHWCALIRTTVRHVAKTPGLCFGRKLLVRSHCLLHGNGKPGCSSPSLVFSSGLSTLASLHGSPHTDLHQHASITL